MTHDMSQYYIIITITLYLATSRHENLQLDPSCLPCTGKTHIKFKVLQECRVIRNDLKNCDITTNYNNEFYFWV
jgi:hypothetical protein